MMPSTSIGEKGKGEEEDEEEDEEEKISRKSFEKGVSIESEFAFVLL